ncbi:uncharacterized protein LOC143846687 [Tasmannia lanceolata]|uniref:uncharacterized protein LOC143846687 n=1 Tax=Tasmannia lanceolata TaxID=3420 RepID=UPI004064BD42
MKLKKDCMKLCVIVFYLSVAATNCTQCEARSSRDPKASHHVQGLAPKISSIKTSEKLKKLKPLKHLLINPSIDPSITQPNADSPYSMPPLDDPLGALSPFSLPQDTTPLCKYPPLTPYYDSPVLPIQSPPPQTFIPSPPAYSSSPPENSPIIPIPPEYVPSPPSYVPNPPENVPSPPNYVPNPPESVPNPPNYELGPPESEPSPPEYVPGPPLFQPPVIFPPPSVPPPPYSGPTNILWCVAKPSVPDPIIQEAMNYACGSGADCDSIQPNGPCYHPDTLLAHASYAFNSYWQGSKLAGGTCDFGGTAMLVTQDPSFDMCHF